MHKPQTLDYLEDNIRRVIADIRPQMLEKSSKIDVQIDYIRASHGSPMPEIIFKINESPDTVSAVTHVGAPATWGSGETENILAPCKIRFWAPKMDFTKGKYLAAVKFWGP
ncbi:hypothetical protein TNCV_4597081 [Trichonephila clavipes]|uniref:Uncharacterized protein n=1 Tax=Trichonephila clavipes TaxID=2585209 RepID=A0A8X6WFR8_TRICX|nr:hypothetical protein TNCV_4597081 [Trichonephila clavipes]